MMCKQGSARAILTGVLAGKLERYLGAIAKRSDAPPIAPLEFLAVSLGTRAVGNSGGLAKRRLLRRADHGARAACDDTGRSRRSICAVALA